jgi:hypothetical protein
MKILRRRWFQILVSGLVLLYLLERTLLATQGLNYVPSVLLLGAFLLPVAFVTYLYEWLPECEVSPNLSIKSGTPGGTQPGGNGRGKAGPLVSRPVFSGTNVMVRTAAQEEGRDDDGRPR